MGEESAATIVSKSIYILCIGSDDIANTYLSTPVRRPYYDIPAYTDLMINSASSFLQVNVEELQRSAWENEFFVLETLLPSN